MGSAARERWNIEVQISCKFIGVALLVLTGAILFWAYIAYPAEYVNRVLRWGNSDVYDYRKFPARVIEAPESHFEFALALAEDRVRAQFETDLGIEDLDAFLADNLTQAFIVIQRDAILYERYFNDSSRNTIVTSFSIAKSFTSTLIGLAIRDGFIDGVSEPITTYLPELLERDPEFSNITIRDLLMMASGISYEEFPFVSGDDAKTYYYPDLRTLALEDTFVDGPPGHKFLYNNFHPLLLGLIIERATGMTVSNYLQERVWKRIGMQFPASWSLDERGFEKMESGINARAVDFAKFGRLFLRGGNWDGVQIVPDEWVTEATEPDTSVDYERYYDGDYIFANRRGYYKYMWWGIRRDERTYDFIAEGNHGQFVYIAPHKDLIILRFGESYGSFHGSKGWLDMFYDFASHFDARD